MFRSIRIKLTIWYVSVLALTIAALIAVTYSLFVSVLKEESDRNLSEIAKSMVDSVADEQSDAGAAKSPDAQVSEALEEFRFRDYQFAILSNDHRLISKTMEADLPAGLEQAFHQERFQNFDMAGQTYRVHMAIFHIENHNYKLYVFHSLVNQMALQAGLRRIFYLLAPGLLLVAGIGGYFLARKSLGPIAKMGDQAKLISAQNLHERLPVVNANDELGDLAVTFNQLLDRLDVEFDRQRRFMADASHELRTPLAIVQGESDVALLKETRSSDEYRESLRVVNDESRRLTKIVEDLFTLARGDSGKLRTEFREMYVDEVLADCVRAVRTLADKRDITIEMDNQEKRLSGDETLLRRLFINLLDNAIKYNYDGGRIRAGVGANNVTIENTGPEIPADKVDLIFERFYRADKTRSGNIETLTSGAGLGLAIAKLIAELHNADIKYTRSGELNIFCLTFEH